MQPLTSRASEVLTTSSTSQGSDTLDVLLVLRALACLMVVVIHCNPPRNAILFRGIDVSWLLFSHGLVAVWIFFCLSGYLMGKAFSSGRYSLTRRGVLNFWRNRALRILPLYGVTVLLLSILVYPEILKLENWGILLRICTFTYQPYLSPQPLNFNGVVWSLSTEVQFYLVVPFLYAILKRHVLETRGIYFTIVATILAVFSLKLLIWLALSQKLTTSMQYVFNYWYTPLATNLDIFLIGFLMNPLIQARSESAIQNRIGKEFGVTLPKSLKSRMNQIIAVALLILLYLFTAHHFYHQELWSMDLPRTSQGFRTTTTIFILQPVTALVTAYFIVAFESNAPAVSVQKLSFAALLQNPYRILEIFGNLSYGVYLWHLPILQNITPIFTAPVAIDAFFLRLMVTLFLSLVLATLTYFTIERPAARWKIYRPTAD
jgi:peptidoglycan/LPS O-acetylase OafA/YrhL